MTPKVKLRASQERIMQYEGGLMAISAVPGSGKTFTLSHLAAKLVLEVGLGLEQEILVVTFSNSAADNFSARIGQILGQKGFIEGYGYKVRTLHGLANDIIHERPDLVGLSNDFAIVDSHECERILHDIVFIKMQETPEVFENLLATHLSAHARKDILEDKKKLPDQIYRIASAYIRIAKDHLLSQNALDELIAKASGPSELLLVCQSIFHDYQAALAYRGGVDFDDLIRLAWIALNSDSQLLSALQDRWPIILEDEAQDSSMMQEAILALLSSRDNNWVRVGDPNQSINESFTTANPKLLREFAAREDVRSETLPESGRSCLEIISLANMLNEWSQNAHPNINIRDGLSLPLIQPTAKDDPQANPLCSPPAIEIVERSMSSDEEIVYLMRSVRQWIEVHPDDTVAVLALSNTRVGKIAKALEDAGLSVVDSLLRIPQITFTSAGAITLILRSIQLPSRGKGLANTFKVIFKELQDDEKLANIYQKCMIFIRGLKQTEDFLYPEEGEELIVSFEGMLEEDMDIAIELLEKFKQIIRRWHKATILPLDQFILTVAQDLTLPPVELAIFHKLSQLAKQLIQENPDWETVKVAHEIEQIAKNDRGFVNLNESNEGFNPDLYKGQVVVATFHKSKGLEWDKVFLTSVNSFDFPSGALEDNFLSEKYYFIEPQNKQAEIAAELKDIINHGGKKYQEGRATFLARNDVARERLRLLYVGVTRAKKSLTLTWNTGSKRSPAAVALQAISERWRNES